MQCKNCGMENEVGAAFCKGCGTKLIEEPLNQMETNPTQNIEQPINNNQIINNVQQIDNNTINDIQQINNNTINNDQNEIEKTKKDNKKLFIILGVIVAILIIIAIIFALSGNKEEDNTSSSNTNNENNISTNYFSYKTDNLFKVTVDGKVGYIDYDGNEVIKPQYSSGEDFHGDYAKVTIENGGTADEAALIDKQGNVKFRVDKSYLIKYTETGFLIDNKLYDINLNKISSDGIKVNCPSYEGKSDECVYLQFEDETNHKHGIMKTDGTITYQEDMSDNFADVRMKEVKSTIKERYCVVSPSVNIDRLVSCENGKVIYDGGTADIIIESYDNIFKIKSRSTRQIYKTIYVQNDMIAAQSSDNVSFFYSDKGYLVVTDKSSGKEVKTYITNNGTVSEEPKDNLEDRELYDGYKVFKSNGKYGLNKDGKEIIPAEYKDIKLFKKEDYEYIKKLGREFAILQGDSKYYVYNITDKKVQAEFSDYYPYAYDNFIDSTVTAYSENGKYYLYSIITGRSIELEIGNKSRTNSDNDYIKLEDSNGYYIYNSEFKLIYTINKKG